MMCQATENINAELYAQDIRNFCQKNLDTSQSAFQNFQLPKLFSYNSFYSSGYKIYVIFMTGICYSLQLLL